MSADSESVNSTNVSSGDSGRAVSINDDVIDHSCNGGLLTSGMLYRHGSYRSSHHVHSHRIVYRSHCVALTWPTSLYCVALTLPTSLYCVPLTLPTSLYCVALTLLTSQYFVALTLLTSQYFVALTLPTSLYCVALALPTSI